MSIFSKAWGGIKKVAKKVVAGSVSANKPKVQASISKIGGAVGGAVKRAGGIKGITASVIKATGSGALSPIVKKVLSQKTNLMSPHGGVGRVGKAGSFSYATPEARKEKWKPKPSETVRGGGQRFASPYGEGPGDFGMQSYATPQGGTGAGAEVIVPPKTTPPTNVSQIGGGSEGVMGKASIPSSGFGSNTMGLSTNANASVAGQNAKADDDRLALIEAEKARALEAEQARSAESKNWWQDLMGNKKTREEELAETRDEYGVDIKARLKEQAADAAEYDTMASALGQMEAAKNAQILQTNDFLGSRNFLNNMVGKIERNAAPPIYALNAQMSAKAAQMQAKAQNWAEADKLIAQSVEYAMADQKDYLDMMGKMYADNQDSLDRMNPIYKNAFEKKYDLLTEQYKQDEAEKMEMMKLAIKYGINVDPTKDTLSSVQQRIIKSGGTLAMEKKTEEEEESDASVQIDEEYLMEEYSTKELWDLALALGIQRKKNLTRRDEVKALFADSTLMSYVKAMLSQGYSIQEIINSQQK